MEENRKTETPQENHKMSYEDLRNIAGQLQQQNVQLRQALEQNNYTNVFKRLEYLFKVVENPVLFDTEFVDTVVKEIQTLMTLPKEEEDTEETKEE